MMKKFTSNLSLKLISLFMAVVVWAAIMNIIDPVTTGQVSLHLEVKNADYISNQNKSYTILGAGNITVKYKVKTKSQSQISENDFKVYVDLKDLELGEDIKVYYDYLNKNRVDEKISDIQVEPQTVKVVIEDKLQSNYPVKYDLKGKLASSRTIGNIILSPDVVYVSGSKEMIGKIDHVGIDIDLSLANNEDSFSGSSKVNIYDASGEVLSNSDLELSATEIGYSVLLYSTASVQVNASVIGTPEYGYKLLETIVEPNTIMVEGPGSFIKNYYVVDLAPVSIDGLTESKEFTLKLANFLPTGVKSKTSDIKVVAVIADNIIGDQVKEKIGPHLDSDVVASETAESSGALESSAEKTSEEETSETKAEVIESSVASTN